MTDIITLGEARIAPALSNPLIISDARLASLITAVSDRLEQYCRRIFVSTAHTDDYDGIGRQLSYEEEFLILRNAPVTALTAVTITDADGDTYVIALTDLNFIARTGRLWFNRVVDDSDYNYWLAGNQNIEVQYTAGWTVSGTMPEAIKEAVRLFIIYINAQTRSGIDPLMKSEKLGDYAYTKFDSTGADSIRIPAEVRAMIDPYRRNILEQP